jgi:hypothetical protein
MPEAKRAIEVDATIEAERNGRRASRVRADFVKTLRGASLATALMDQQGYVLVDRVADRFGMSKGQLADTIGIPPDNLYRPERLKAPKTQSRAIEMLEIVGRLVNWAGGERQAMAWYRAEPIPAFGGRTAEALVKDGKAAAVRDYLDHIATGGFA